MNAGSAASSAVKMISSKDYLDNKVIQLNMRLLNEKIDKDLDSSLLKNIKFKK